MAFIVNDSYLMDTTEVEEDDQATDQADQARPRESTFAAAKTFLETEDVPAHHFAHPPMAVSSAHTAANKMVRKNLLEDFEDPANSSSIMLPPPPATDTIRVYLRVKPKTMEESAISHEEDDPDATAREDDETVRIETDHQVALLAPKESNAYKNSVNGVGLLTHRYSFTKVFAPETTQSGLFSEMVLPRVNDFLEGFNQLLFTYGATSSGKTYTIQGSAADPGILPRALDVIFNSVGDKLLTTMDVRPNCFNRVVQMKEKDVAKVEADKANVFALGRELQVSSKKADGDSKMSGISQLCDTQDSIDFNNLSSQSLASMFPHLSNREKESAKATFKQNEDNMKFAVWISFAEIYNENIHDLLEKIPAPKRKGEKPRRPPLKLAEDKNGSIFIRDLKEIKVNSADEAYQVMMIGRENLQFAATRLNHHSSRSHCIFTIKAIRVANIEKPHLARVSMLSFCDLAGSERIKKTMNTGDRQKEAGNINTSLLVLGRCIKAIRHNQVHKSQPKKHMMVPFRESKLTRLFQSFLVGHGKASMVVNVSQAPYLFDESLQVLKFAAIASKITVEEESPPTPETVKPNRKRQTRFSIMVENKSAMNPLMGRGSIAWEQPAARSTMCPPPRGAPSMLYQTAMAETTELEETMVDERYEGLLELIDNLKNQLIKEKQEKITLEREIRHELTTEFSQMMVEIEESWEKRYQDQIVRSEELNNWRIAKMEEAYRSKRKRQRESDDVSTARARAEAAASEGGSGNETIMFAKDELEIKLEDKETELKCLQEKLSTLEEMQTNLLSEQKKQEEKLAAKTMELNREKEKSGDLEVKLEKTKSELAETREIQKAKVEKDDSAQPVIEDLTKQLKEMTEKVETLEADKLNLKELLDEAGQDFIEKAGELKQLSASLKEAEAQILQQSLELNELNSQLEESRLLLTDSAARIEEKEKHISELEERVSEDSKAEVKAVKAKMELDAAEKKTVAIEKELAEVKETLEKKEAKFEVDLNELRNSLAAKDAAISDLKDERDELKTQQRVSTAERESADEMDKTVKRLETEKTRIERELNDEIEVLKTSKKKQKTTIDEQSAKLDEVTKDLTKTQRELRSITQTEKNSRKRNEELQYEIDMLQKQVKDLNARMPTAKDAKEESVKQKELQSTIEKLELENKALKKEDDALAVLKSELETRSQERTTLAEKLAKFESENEALRYDLAKAKEEKQTQLDHYDKALNSKVQELAREKRELATYKDVMLKSTPGKSSEAEIKSLRDQLLKQTQVIKQLEGMIPAKNESAEEELRDLQDEVSKLNSELKLREATHSKELAKVKKSFEKLIAEYKESNLNLQKQVVNGGANNTMTDASTLEGEGDEADDDSAADSDVISDTPARKRQRRGAKQRSKRANNSGNKTDSAAQASFEDSMAENDPDASSANERPKRATRLTRGSRPVSKRNNKHLSGVDSSLMELDANSSTTAEKLTPVAGRGSGAGGRKRTLYNASKNAEVFTPPLPSEVEETKATPKTIVKRQLRSRSARKH